MWNLIQEIPSAEGNVIKFVYSNQGAVAESVLYRYPDYATRTVICCSTQSGCPVGCRFCGAGDNFVRSLSVEEIVSQVDFSIEKTGTDPNIMQRLQIMFMSMGEPLLNMKNVVEAIKVLHAKYPKAALLLSSTGPKVDYEPLLQVATEIPTVGLQFSVHESTDEKRDLLIPFRGKHNLAGISEKGQEFFERTGRKPFFNYCAGDGNTSAEDADRLAATFDPQVWECTISVICERNEGLPTRNQHQVELARSFSNKMLQRGFGVRVFDPAGQDDIGGGCGQLWFVQRWMQEHPELARPSIGRGKPVVHVPML